MRRQQAQREQWEQQRRAEEESARQQRLEHERQQHLRLEQARRGAELQAQQDADEAGRRRVSFCHHVTRKRKVCDSQSF